MGKIDWNDKEAVREYRKKYRQEHKEDISKYNAEWRKKNPDYNSAYQNEWRKNNPDYHSKYNVTPIGRANNLLSTYNQSDKKYGRGFCTLTAKWILENIFNQPCRYCGRTDWTKIGCDRVDDSLPHTPDNVVPCCASCNRKKKRMKKG